MRRILECDNIEMTVGESQIGSDPSSDILLTGLGMEPKHAVIRRDADGMHISILGFD